MNNLNGKLVLVTGATGYLGSSMARALYRQGATLVVLSRDSQKLRLTFEDLEAQANRETEIDNKRDGQVHGKMKHIKRINYLSGSLATHEEAAECVDTLIQRVGVPDILVNCIGHAEDKPFVFHRLGDARTSFYSNLYPFIHICSALIPHFKQRGSGNIINMASITGVVGQPMRSLYGAAKGAVISYCKVLARRHAADNIRVNCIAPQVVTGGLAEKMNPKIKAMLQATTPIQRNCMAEDLIAPLLMLACSSEGFITGEVVNVTGGLITW